MDLQSLDVSNPHPLGDEIVTKLKQEHQKLEQRLDELNELVYLTPEEQRERKEVQKLKLLNKDKVAVLIK
jgi:hypothetical protein